MMQASLEAVDISTGAPAPGLPARAFGQRGQNLVQDVKREMPDFAPSFIFDVGANIGDCAKEYASEFPGSSVYCFEPVASTFADLERNMQRFANCRCFQFGFGDENGIVDMLSNQAHANRSYVLSGNEAGPIDVPSASIIQASLETIDGFCAEAAIAHIDLLKIDTEGFDMKVLLGAHRMLERGGIKFVLVEAGMYAGNTHHVPFMDLCAHLEPYGFVLFGIYDQCREWMKDLPYLRRADLAFIRK